MTNHTPVVSVRGIFKSFGGINVLKNIDLDIRPGEVHGLLGENGAGKSTLAKIIAGVHQPNAGTITIKGKTEVVTNPARGAELGIALIHQEPLAFPDLDVAENIFIGRQPTTRQGWVNWRSTYALAEEQLTKLGVNLNPRAKMRGLSIADQQMVDMASALSQDAKVILMDEPTASLTPSEVGNLFKIMRRLREQEVAIVFVSHRLEEIFEICDRITVLRDGEFVGERTPENTSTDEIINLMVGRSVKALFEKPAPHTIGRPVLEIKGLSRRRKFNNINIEVKAGEIVGVAGLVGAGRTDVAKALVGVQDIDAGTITIDGQTPKIKSPQDALEHGMVYVPEDRQHQGLFMPMSMAQNVTMPLLKELTKFGWLNDQAERTAGAEYVKKLSINLRHVDQPARELSGGNQQKVVLSKWLMTNPRVMILDEPTRGIDVGAKVEIHRLMVELTQRGMAILMISSELPEILALSDKIIVMKEGEITGYFDKDQASAEQIMAAATGQSLEEVAAE